MLTPTGTEQWLRPVLIAGIVCFAGCMQRPASDSAATAHLPGFSIQLPAGVVEKSTPLASHGSHRLRLVPAWVLSLPPPIARWRVFSDGEIDVHWRVGTLSPEDRGTMRKALIGTVRSVASVRVRSEELSGGRWLSYLEAGSGTGAVGGNLSDGFGRVADNSKVMYYGVDGSVMVVSSSDGDVVGSGALTRVMSGMLQAILAPGSQLHLQPVALEHADPGRLAFFEVQGVTAFRPTRPVFVGAVYCEELDLTYFLLGTGPSLSQSQWNPLLAQADCRGKTSRPIPPAAEVLGNACDRGNRNACDTLKEISPGNGATVP